MGILNLIFFVALYQLPSITLVQSNPNQFNPSNMVSRFSRTDEPTRRLSSSSILPPTSLEKCGPGRLGCRPSQKQSNRVGNYRGERGFYHKRALQDQCGGVCKFGMSCCAGVCVDLKVDIRNCGKCNNVCGDDDKCENGMCGYG